MATATKTKKDIPEWMYEKVQEWQPNMPYPKETTDLILDAKSFQAWMDAEFPEIAKLPPVNIVKPDVKGVVALNDRWLVGRRVLPVFEWAPRFLFGKSHCDKTWLELLRNGRKFGQVCFLEPIAIPSVVQKQVWLTYEPWMSLTPSEVMTQRPGIRAAKGRVLIGGLGMGWAAGQIAQKKGVTKVVVVEQEKVIADYFGKFLKQKAKVPVTIVEDDFYKYANRHLNDFDTIISDIWKGYMDAPYDSDWKALKATFKGKIWGWGDYSLRDD